MNILMLIISSARNAFEGRNCLDRDKEVLLILKTDKNYFQTVFLFYFLQYY